MADKRNVRFRMSDGTDLGPFAFELSATLAEVKDQLLAGWPSGGTPAPGSANDLRLIHAGKLLEHAKTLADANLGAEAPDALVTMHLVVRPPTAKPGAKAGAGGPDDVRPRTCGCTLQ